MSKNVETAMNLFKKELEEYACTKKVASGAVLHLSPLGETGYCIGTFTAYGDDARKSESAMPFRQYIKVINQLETLLEEYQANDFVGRLVGWNPPTLIKEFLYEKKVHRFFFINEDDVMEFMKKYSSKSRVKYRKDIAASVSLVFE